MSSDEQPIGRAETRVPTAADLWRTALPRVGVFDRMALKRRAPKAFIDRAPHGATIINRASTHSIPSENIHIMRNGVSHVDHDEGFLSNVGHLLRETVWTNNRRRALAVLPPDRCFSVDTTGLTGHRRTIVASCRNSNECCPLASFAGCRSAHRQSDTTKLPGWSCQ